MFYCPIHMYEGNYHLRGSSTKLTVKWNAASRIIFIAPLENLHLKIYRLSVLTETDLTVPWVTQLISQSKGDI